MADALALRVKQLMNYFMKFNLSCGKVAPDAKVKMSGSFDGLMNCLRQMMIGYETEEVQALFKEMEGAVASEAWYSHEETVMRSFGIARMVNEASYRYQKKRLDKIIVICEQLCNIRYNSDIEGEEAVVGFDNEVEILLDQLTGTSAKQFQVISIAGTAGLDEFYGMSDQQLGEKLYRKLKGRKYLVVFDDIWDYKVWNDLKMYFPDDKTGSRVLFTSRDIDVSLHVQSARPAHVLRLRTEVESWDIFVKKVLRTGICPFGLEILGRVIIRKCEGLPLAIVIAAGLLKNNLPFTWWSRIAASLRSFMVSDPSQYMDSLALSYNHLPSHLRPCFLYFGTFPEDHEIPVTKLIWLWVAQGFIRETGSRIMEDVAEDFLKDLIKRSLVMTPRINSDGSDARI